MLRLFALTALVVNPPLYLAMKGSAYVRHHAFKSVVEQDTIGAIAAAGALSVDLEEKN